MPKHIYHILYLERSKMQFLYSGTTTLLSTGGDRPSLNMASLRVGHYISYFTGTNVNNIILFVAIHYTSLIEVPTVKCFPHSQVFSLWMLRQISMKCCNQEATACFTSAPVSNWNWENMKERLKKEEDRNSEKRKESKYGSWVLVWCTSSLTTTVRCKILKAFETRTHVCTYRYYT